MRLSLGRTLRWLSHLLWRDNTMRLSLCLFLAFEPIYSWQKKKKFQHAYDLSYSPCFSTRHKCKLMCSNILTQGSAWQISLHTFLLQTDALKVQPAPFGCIITALFSSAPWAFANEIKPLLLICPHTLLHIPMYLSSQTPFLYLPFRFCPQALEHLRMWVQTDYNGLTSPSLPDRRHLIRPQWVSG